MAEVANQIHANSGRSELLRGIPDFRKPSSNPVHRSAGAVNPLPASVARKSDGPRNGHDLGRGMARCPSSSAKVEWLAEIPCDAFAKIFRVEIDAELFQLIIAAMDDAMNATIASDDTAVGDTSTLAAKALRTLVAIVDHCEKAFRFAASFAGEPERAREEKLLTMIADKCGDSAADDVQRVRAALFEKL